MELDEACLVGLKLFLGVEVVRVIFDIEGLRLIAEMDAFFKLMLNHIHLSNDSLDAY